MKEAKKAGIRSLKNLKYLHFKTMRVTFRSTRSVRGVPNFMIERGGKLRENMPGLLNESGYIVAKSGFFRKEGKDPTTELS